MSLTDDAGSPVRAENEEIPRLRAEIARLQLERDAAVTGRYPTGAEEKKGPGAVRRIIALFLVGLTAILAFAAVPALYLRSQVLDTDRYVATIAPLASDPAIQAEIADRVTTQIADAADIDGITRDALAELGNAAPRVAAALTGLAPAIASQTKALIHSAVSKFIAGPGFQNLWVQVNRVGHQGLANLASGDSDGAVSVDQSGTVTVSTQEIIAGVKALLVEQGVEIAARIPEVQAQVIMLQSAELGQAAGAIRTLDRTAPVLAWLTVFSGLGAIAVAPRGRRRRATSDVGLGIAVAMAALALGIAVGVNYFLGTIPATTVSPAAAGSLVEALVAPLRTGVRFVFVVAVLIAVAALLSGHSRAARTVRLGVVRTGDYLSGKMGTTKAKPWHHALARVRRILEGGVTGAAVLVLVLWPFPTAAVAIWTAVLAGLGILFIELLSRPAVVEQAADPRTGDDGDGPALPPALP
ncbi:MULTISPECIES: hypothetical protein [unclassified Arthrobacter]|uniref:hypothetical protein n=1 Tax=unclassified Arthrobacter TaxID=235627 RepID=UPI002E0166AA|nr:MULTISPECIES: hypothetical protein [unclassified Arthrobacter]MEC5190859.1 hypothetical protein [Arthrobacter sp. MP_M4]MEC5202123.1 hypothetical protein [Arthrobacter sp. MP_M7]